MQLFQYWNAEPPAEILAFMEAARNAGLDYVRLDETSARAFVAHEHGERACAAWDRLAIPAARADLLRLLLMERRAGVYLDAGYLIKAPLMELASRSAHGQMPSLIALAFNGYLMIRRPGNAFFRACIEVLLDNVEHRRFDSVLMATGPGIINAVRAVLLAEERPFICAQAEDTETWMRWGWPQCLAVAQRLIEPTPERAAACRAIDIVHFDELECYLESGSSPHRRRHDHWTRWKGGIYN